ncbi:MAG: hypothetical protein ACRDQA_25405 [Nocardioidaceae bacterium]
MSTVTAQRSSASEAVERWFDRHGLPYFVAEQEASVRRALSWTRVVPVVLGAVVLAALVGPLTGVGAHNLAVGVFVGCVVVGLVLLVYGFLSLHLRPIVRWAAGTTFGSFGWLFPLVTRALPLLLLFVTFLFINTEVWQVCSTIDRGLLWMTVLLFAVVAVLFLLVRLPEEVRQVCRDARGERLVAVCAGTPVAEVAAEVVERTDEARLSWLQRVNVVLVLLFSQMIQVLLLSLLVFCFFIGFGKMAISDAVVEAWVGHGPTSLPTFDWLPVSNELFQVSLFLAAFSGLYFTVYAVSDDAYRREFFTPLREELERAVGVQIVYRALARV